MAKILSELVKLVQRLKVKFLLFTLGLLPKIDRKIALNNSAGWRLILVLVSCVVSAQSDLAKQDYSNFYKNFGIGASMLTWGVAMWKYSYVFIVFFLVISGLVFGRLDRAGCVMVAIGILFAFGNHYSKTTKQSIVTATRNAVVSKSKLQKPFEDNFLTFAQDKYIERSIRWEFLLVFFGTLIWGFGA